LLRHLTTQKCNINTYNCNYTPQVEDVLVDNYQKMQKSLKLVTRYEDNAVIICIESAKTAENSINILP